MISRGLEYELLDSAFCVKDSKNGNVLVGAELFKGSIAAYC